MSESIHSLGLRDGGDDDSAILEYADLQSSGTTPEYEHHNFPYAYSYAKHLTERLLIHHFSHTAKHGDRSSSLLIIRPSVIGPALQDPFPNYEIRGSAPTTTCLAALIITPSRRIVTACRFPHPDDQATMDEVPVDIVVNRILVHTARRPSGIVHAVAGQAGSRSIHESFEPAMAHRQNPWGSRLVWRDVDWKDHSLHPIMQTFKIIGTAYVFEQARTEEAWAGMSVQERRDFPLMVRPGTAAAAAAAVVEVDEDGEEDESGLQHQPQQQKKGGSSSSVKGSVIRSHRNSAAENDDNILLRRASMETVLRKWFKRRGVPTLLADQLTRGLLPSTA